MGRSIRMGGDRSMNKYMVRYWNGRGIREKYFTRLEDAKKFVRKNDDEKAEIWKKEEND